LNQAWNFVPAVLLIATVGWVADRALDAGLRVPGFSLVVGFAGYLFGTWVWDTGGLGGGPIVASVDLVPLAAGTLIVAFVLKLVGLGVTGPRR
jgi:hypothetical protein